MTTRTWTNPRYAVIPTTGRDCFYEALAAIQPQVDRIYVVWAPNQPVPRTIVEGVENLYGPLHTEKRNISRWWNMGIDGARTAARIEGALRWEVAILNDDVIVPHDWFERIASRMRQLKVVAASMGSVHMPTLHTSPGPTNLHQRMQGFAFILAGEVGVRADESLEWWCGDNDIDMQSRLRGGTLVLPDTGVKHLYPDQSTTGELALQTAIDMDRFVRKWGFRPWNL